MHENVTNHTRLSHIKIKTDMDSGNTICPRAERGQCKQINANEPPHTQ